MYTFTLAIILCSSLPKDITKKPITC